MTTASKVRKKRAPAVGYTTKRGGMKKIAVYFDEDTFAEIRTQADLLNVSFTKAVRLLVEWGLEA